MDVIDLFSGTGAFSYAFNNQNFNVVFANDYDFISKKIYELNFPNHNYCIEDLHKLQPEDIPYHDVMCSGFPCFIAGTRVLTNNGYKDIENVQLTDKLLTHSGKFQSIINLQQKIYSGDLFNFDIKYHPETITCTNEHPIYIRKKNTIWNNDKRRYNTSFDNPKWISADKITTNDYFGMVINNNEIIPEFTFEKKINYKKTVNETITLDKKEMWYMMGYFVGDGWTEDGKKSDGRCKYTIKFSINNNDHEEVLRKISCILNITDKKCSTGKCNKFGCSNFIWYNILKEFGKYAHGKLIPEWVQDAPNELIDEFINGYMKADGCSYANGCFQITTVSPNLAYGLQRLYLKLGHIFSVNKDIRPKTCIIEGRTVNQRDTYRIRGYLNLKRKSQGFIDNGYAWFPLKSIKTTHTENTPVYNFEVEEDNSYTVSNISVHNCQPFSIAGNQAGFEDSRSNVFWKMLEIIQYHKPSIILIENVKNLKSHDKGNTFQIIHNKLVEKGYHLKYAILDTGKYTNIPQHRERIYIVGFRDKNLYNKFDFDFEEVANDHITDFLEEDIPEKYYYTDKYKVYPIVSDGVVSHVNNNVLYQFRRYYLRENKSNQCPTLTANMGTGGHNVPLLLDDNGIRKLTPRECFNLQGFPKDYQLPNLCDSDLYKLAGNAVSIPIVELIVEKIKNVISE